ncbi:hypothetical protein ACRRTK_010838 [Alexandromys fortis]
MATGAGPGPRPGFYGLFWFQEGGRSTAEKLTLRWVSGECERTEFVSLRVQAELIPEQAALVSRGAED